LLGRERTAGIGEIDRAVGLYDDVVRTEQALALEGIGNDGEAAVGFLARDAAREMFGRDDAALQIAGEAVGLVGLLQGHRGGALARRVFHPARVFDVVEEEIAAFLDPHRAFRGTDIAAITGGELADRLVGGDDVGQSGIHLLDALCSLSCPNTASAACKRKATRRTRHCQHVPA